MYIVNKLMVLYLQLILKYVMMSNPKKIISKALN